MAKLMRAAQSYWAGNNFVAENKVMHEGDPDMIADYCEEFTLPEPPAAAEEPKRGPGRPPKAQG
jgi:hypothetical protein